MYLVIEIVMFVESSGSMCAMIDEGYHNAFYSYWFMSTAKVSAVRI